MRLIRFASALLVVALCGPPVASAQLANSQSELSANAAVQYWQAFAQMPTLDKDQEKLLEHWNTVPLDAAAQKLITSSQNSLMYLHRGAKVASCDWGLDYNDGISLLLPHLAKARDLSRMAALHARLEFEQRHWQAGQTDAMAIMTLGRHVGRDPIMICLLVRYAIEGNAVELLAPFVSALKTPYAETAKLYDALPKIVTVHQTIFTEKKFMAEWAINKIKQEEQRKKGSGLELWKRMFIGQEGPEGTEIPEAVKNVQSFEEALKLTEDLLPVYDQLAKFVALPKSEFDAQYPSFKQKTKAANAVAGVLLPSVDKVLAKEQRNQTRVAMLLAAFAVAEGGPEKLKDIKDPFGSGPFTYRALDKGFELKSELLVNDQPVTLTVGAGK